MPKFIGDVEITLRYTLHDVVVDAPDEDSAAELMEKKAEDMDSDELLNLGKWGYDAEVEEACPICEQPLDDCDCFDEDEGLEEID